MKKSFKSVIILCLALTTAVFISLPGYGQKQNKGSKSRDTKSKESVSEGIKLAYNFPPDKPFSYSSMTTIKQEMDYNGQTMEVNVAVVLACTITSAGKDNDNLKLNVRIDTLSQKVDSPQGSSGGVIDEVAGKSFNMIVGPNGKEVDVSEAEKLTYTAEGNETNASQSFQDYFPDLPVNPIKPGDTWSGNDTLKSKATTMSMKELIHGDNKFEGVVTIDGIECAKITSVIKGTRDQTGQNMGMDLSIKGDFTGTVELYFAIKEGYLVKETSTSKMVGVIDISGAQSMSMPLTATTQTLKWLKK